MPSDQLFKIIVIGQSKVGKTSFVRRYVNGIFNEGYKVTIGVDFAVKTIEWSSDQIVRLQFWDIQGQEDTLPLTRAFYKDADACIIMFDLANHKSFQYCTLLKQAVDSEILAGDGLPIPCVLLGNKCDLANHAVSSQEVEDISNILQCTAWKEISVKENSHIEETVRCVVESILDRQPPQPPEESYEDITKTGPLDDTLENHLGKRKYNQNTPRSCCGLNAPRDTF